MSRNSPAIVMMAHDRLTCLKRLLSSVARADFDGYDSVNLVISIDGEAPEEVREAADRFQWSLGTKQVICHDPHLGLRDHALFCGDLTEEHEAIVLLEDDSYVSQTFYRFAEAALRFYRDHDDIAGISLYSPLVNEAVRLPFIPLNDDSDVFFMQLPNLTAAWDRIKWREFKSWYGDQGGSDIRDYQLPPNMTRWPDSSWKKFAAMYLLDSAKYYVYPRHSLITDFCDKGTHFRHDSNDFQVPIEMEHRKYRFKPANRSCCLYDAYFELLPEAFKGRCPQLASIDFAVDLYGTKAVREVGSPFVLTTRRPNKWTHSFAKRMRPLELNVIESIPGKGIYLCHIDSIDQRAARTLTTLADNMDFWFSNLSLRRLLIMAAWRLRRRLTRLIRSVLGDKEDIR